MFSAEARQLKARARSAAATLRRSASWRSVRTPSTAPRNSSANVPESSIASAMLEPEEGSVRLGVAAWIAEARSRAGDELIERIRAVSFGDSDTFRHLLGLAYDSPAPRDVPAFIGHLRETDPLELRNLSRVPAYADVLAKMKQLYELLAKMKQLYERYSDCREDQCRAELPKAWRLTPAQERQLTDHELKATTQYFAH